MYCVSVGVYARGRVRECVCASTTMRACLRVIGRGCDRIILIIACLVRSKYDAIKLQSGLIFQE